MNIYCLKIRSALPYLLSAGLVLYLVISGIYYEAALDTVTQTYINGIFSGGCNALPDTFGLFVLLASPMNFLYRLFPDINWYDCFHALILTVILCWLIKTLILPPKKGSLSKVILSAFFCLTISSRIFQPVELTRTSMLLAAISIIEVYREDSLARRLIWGGLFFVSLLMRVESGLLSFAIATPFFLMDATNHINGYKNWLKKTLFLSSLIFTVSLLVNIPKTSEEKYYLKIRPYEYSLTDFDRERAVVNLENKNDSVIFRSCVNFFFADSSRCNLAFFNRIGLLQFDKTPISMLGRLQNINVPPNKWHAFMEVLKSVKWLLILTLFIILVMSRYGVYNIRSLMANLYALFLICFVSLWLKPEEHVFAPALTILILLNLIWIKQHPFSTSRTIKLALCITTFGLMTIEMHSQLLRLEQHRQLSKYYTSVGNYLQAHNSENYILNISSWDEAHHKMFEKNSFAELPHVYVLDGAILYFNSGYQQLMKRATGSTKFIDHWKYFIDSQESIFVSSEERMAMLLQYVNVIYHENYTAHLILRFQSSNVHQHKKSIGLFKIKNNNGKSTPKSI